MTHQRILLAAVVAAIGLTGGNSAFAQKKIFCWNENGKKVCGDALPAEAANNARTEISAKSGMATGQVSRALTDSERTAAAQAADAAQRQAEAEAMAQRRDLAMVESYMTEADLRRAYGDRISLLEESLKTSQLSLGNLRTSLLGLLRQAGDKELAGQPVPQPLTDSIKRQHAELLRQQQILATQKRDRVSLDAELEDAVQRYRALKSPGTESAAPVPTPPAG